MLKKRWVAWASQLLGLAFMITTVVIPHDMQKGNLWPEWAHGVYLSFEKVSFTFGIYLLVLPTLMEIPNIAFFLLDTKFFNFTGKISFWVYLCHFMILERVVFGWETDFYYTPETVVPLFFSISIISLFFGFLGTMLVEVPFSKLEKMLFSVLLRKKKGDKGGKGEKEEVPRVKNPESVVDSSSIYSSTNPSTVGNNSTLLSEDQL
jgi:peptidoglycan/LPS O-acetylase OafA/YrhL